MSGFEEAATGHTGVSVTCFSGTQIATAPEWMIGSGGQGKVYRGLWLNSGEWQPVCDTHTHSHAHTRTRTHTLLAPCMHAQVVPYACHVMDRHSHPVISACGVPHKCVCVCVSSCVRPQVAVKEIDFDSSNSNEVSFYTERKVLRMLSNTPHVLHILDDATTNEGRKGVLILPLAANGSLANRIR